MALVIKDRVRETTTSTGTGTITLAGAVANYVGFSAVGNANTTYYCIEDKANNAWEVGIGTYTSVGTTLARDTVLASSNAGALVNFAAGVKDVFVTWPASAIEQKLTLETVKTATGTSIDFTGIPSWVKKITVILNAVSTNGTSLPIIQLGDAGGIENTGYSGGATGVASTSGFTSYTGAFGLDFTSSTAADVRSGIVTICNISGNTWVASGTVVRSTSAMGTTAGVKTLSAQLDRLRITTINGTDSFDNGSVNLIFE